LIPAFLTSKLAREFGVDKQARTFRPWSHVVALLYAQLTHAMSLNDVCDALRHHGGKLLRIRGATAPSKNALSHANRGRDASMAERLFWETLAHLTGACPRFGGRTFQGMPRRFKRAIHAVDSSTIQLAANCIDWARHRRRKAAAKLHLRLNLQSFLPAFAIVDTAKHNDNKRARELCAGLQADFATVRFPGPQQKRRGVASLDGAASILAAAVCGLRQPLATRLQAVFLPVALERLGRRLYCQPCGAVWDSTRRSHHARSTRAAVFARFWPLEIARVTNHTPAVGQQTDGFAKGEVARDKKYATAVGKPKRKNKKTLGFLEESGIIYAAMGRQ
jgi:hypothetical protein